VAEDSCKTKEITYRMKNTHVRCI